MRACSPDVAAASGSAKCTASSSRALISSRLERWSVPIQLFSGSSPWRSSRSRRRIQRRDNVLRTRAKSDPMKSPFFGIRNARGQSARHFHHPVAVSSVRSPPGIRLGCGDSVSAARSAAAPTTSVPRTRRRGANSMWKMASAGLCLRRSPGSAVSGARTRPRVRPTHLPRPGDQVVRPSRFGRLSSVARFADRASIRAVWPRTRCHGGLRRSPRNAERKPGQARKGAAAAVEACAAGVWLASAAAPDPHTGRTVVLARAT